MNPRDKRPGDRRVFGMRRGGSPLWYVLGGLLLFALVQTWLIAPNGKPVTYSDFKKAVRSGQVAQITVGEQTIAGEYKREINGSKAFSTTRIEDPKLLEELDAAGVRYAGEFVSRWVPELLMWILLLWRATIFS